MYLLACLFIERYVNKVKGGIQQHGKPIIGRKIVILAHRLFLIVKNLELDVALCL